MRTHGPGINRRLLIVWLTALSSLAIVACGDGPDPGPHPDEAMQVGRSGDSFPAADEDYLADMDRGVSQRPEEVAASLAFLGVSPEEALDLFVKGRNNWVVWSGGNDALWDYLANNSFGALDFLKTLSTHDRLGYGRDRGANGRWRYLGLVNEPCFEPATGPDPDRYGLWLDRRIESPECPPDPYASADKYPGVEIGARGQNVPVGSYYGEPSGIVGLRLFPNPNFDEEAEADWDSVAYYEDPTYYLREDLVRPYRVGMSCGFCHVGPSPTNPPADFENPEWENLNSNPGAQYFWIDRIFFWERGEATNSNFVFQLFHTQLPGSLDTSLVSSDNINNPRTMNAVYSLAARLGLGPQSGRETLSGGELNNAQFNDYPATQALSNLFEPPDTVLTPRILKDGSDSVGALGALNRVYLNIGLASEEWLSHFTPLIGPTPTGGPITPIEISVLEEVSSYWQANIMQTPAVGAFFVASAKPDYLSDAPGGDAYLTADEAQLTRGKVVFGETCARCHSSKAPEPPPSVVAGDCAGGGTGPQYLDCWDRYWDWAKTDEFKEAMVEMVREDDFLEGNFLSNERRVPVTLLDTNACSPLATNAIAGNIWNDFSSTSYKSLPSVGTVTVHHPFDGTEREYEMPAGGRGYTRPPSLISLWSTAPFLLNNSVGTFDYRGTVEGRMSSFDDSIEKMLWPERRRKDSELPDLPGYIQRTTTRSYLRIAPGYLPATLRRLLGWRRFMPGEDPTLEIGPIPEGTPVGLLANLPLISEGRELSDRVAHQRRLIDLGLELLGDLRRLPDEATNEQARAAFRDAVPELLALSKCPDFVVNRGHYFGTDLYTEEPGLSDEDKLALIEFLKTM